MWLSDFDETWCMVKNLLGPVEYGSENGKGRKFIRRVSKIAVCRYRKLFLKRPVQDILLKLLSGHCTARQQIAQLLAGCHKLHSCQKYQESTIDICFWEFVQNAGVQSNRHCQIFMVHLQQYSGIDNNSNCKRGWCHTTMWHKVKYTEIKNFYHGRMGIFIAFLQVKMSLVVSNIQQNNQIIIALIMAFDAQEKTFVVEPYTGTGAQFVLIVHSQKVDNKADWLNCVLVLTTCVCWVK